MWTRGLRPWLSLTALLLFLFTLLAGNALAVELFFPWDHDENPWTLTQGPHNWGVSYGSGLDFDKDSTPRRVLSMFKGEVTFVGFDEPFTCHLNGQQTQNPTVKVRATDGSGWEIWYLHLSRYSVSVGTPVEIGDLLGYSGDVGCADHVHIHAELVINGVHSSWWGQSINGYSGLPASPFSLVKWQVNPQRQFLYSSNDTHPPIHPIQNWLMDGSDNIKTTFVRGEAIRYATEVRNVRNVPVTAIFTFRANGLFSWKGSTTVPSGGCCLGLARYNSPSTIPASATPGTYYFEMLITYTGSDIDNNAVTYAAQAAPFTVR